MARVKHGRTSSYKPEYCTLARKLCMLGATNDDLAEVLSYGRFLVMA
jgi:hypothetical protein